MSNPPQWQTEALPGEQDRLCGARLTQLTSAAAYSHNIYCEQRYTSADGSRIAFLRSAGGAPGASGDAEQLWLADVNTGCCALLCERIVYYPTSGLASDWLYYAAASGPSSRLLIRQNMMSLERQPLFDLEKCPFWPWTVPTVSPDERWFVANYRVGGRLYGLYRVDLEQQRWEVIHTQEDALNPHVQFEPGSGSDLLVQLNRDGRCDDHGNIIDLVGPDGATLYVIAADGTQRRDLPLGKPHTAPISGHQCWVGTTGRIILTTIDRRIYVMGPGEERSRCIWEGPLQVAHMAASNDGRYFVTDDFSSGIIYVGSVATGRMIAACDSRASCGEPQHTHPHAYLAPGNRHLIFNSDRTGTGQVWAAELPAGLLDELDRAR